MKPTISTHFATDDELSPSESVALGHAARTISRYRYPILVSVLGAVVFYSAIALVAYLWEPGQKVTVLPFRLEFEGAGRGEYPNGTTFNSAEIIATPILRRAYEAGQLARFVSFQEFSNAIFVAESNAALEQLAREYQAKLSDPKLSSVERERLEREFSLKRDSISRSEYTLNFASTLATKRLPQSLIHKSLRDILAIWAKSAAEEKGVLRYRIPVLTANVVDRSVLGLNNYVIALDRLRSRVESVVRNIDQLLAVPGTEVLRTTPNGLSLTEIRLMLGDTVRFKIQPLLASIQASGAVPDAGGIIRYIESQLEYNELQARTAESKTDALRQSLALYSRQETESPAEPQTRTLPPSSGQSTVMPQISESFLDRLMQLTRQSEDLAYRQKLVEQITEASVNALPYRQEAEYYRELLNRMRGLRSRTPDATQVALIRTQLEDIFNDIATAIDNMNSIYSLLSNNLNTSTTLYTVTAPATVRTERSVSLKRLALYGLLVLLIAVPMAIGGALFHNRIREEEELEDILTSESLRPQEPRVDTQTEFSAGPAART